MRFDKMDWKERISLALELTELEMADNKRMEKYYANNNSLPRQTR